MMIIVVFALMSWLPGAYDSKLGRFLGKLVIPFQRCFDFASIGMISFAPVLALAVLYILQRALVSWIPTILVRILS
ncbi:YggT family protein [uncultured bacterium]|uniref:YggT family protein n=2 Tax=Acetilactobacillus jinshanensis TaxID=1720083 RepID=A0A4P6ZMB1_9LACO|nr:YggT family protein [Acetilactobacillus jinshanensis]URL61892.1 YggT family protein [uncultured bacterium]